MGREEEPCAPLSEPAAAIAEIGSTEKRVLLEIPGDITRLRRESPAVAERWRMVVCQAFAAAFAVGFRAVHFIRDDSSARRRAFYVLERL
jgi:predicted GNAT superfamily acetyltransferase